MLDRVKQLVQEFAGEKAAVAYLKQRYPLIDDERQLFQWLSEYGLGIVLEGLGATEAWYLTANRIYQEQVENVYELGKHAAEPDEELDIGKWDILRYASAKMIELQQTKKQVK